MDYSSLQKYFFLINFMFGFFFFSLDWANKNKTPPEFPFEVRGDQLRRIWFRGSCSCCQNTLELPRAAKQELPTTRLKKGLKILCHTATRWTEGVTSKLPAQASLFQVPHLLSLPCSSPSPALQDPSHSPFLPLHHPSFAFGRGNLS